MIFASAFLRQLQSQDFQPQSFYLLYGEEPLFLRDAMGGLKQRLTQAGFERGEVFEVDQNFDWMSLQMETHSGSLFSQQRFLVLNMPKGSPGKEGAAFFQRWAQQTTNENDICLIVLCEKLDSRQQKSKWVQSIEATGVVVQAKPVPAKEVPNWIHQRAVLNRLQLSAEAASLLAERTEGNLLAADQELIKLSLLLNSAGPQELSVNPDASPLVQVDAQQIVERVVDQAHYQLFALSSSMLTGRLDSSLQRLQRLQQEGIEPPVVLWLLTKELRQLIELQQLSGRLNFAQACKQLRIWSSQQGEYRAALQRGTIRTWQSGLRQALAVDRKIKGVDKVLNDSEIWLGLSDIIVKIVEPQTTVLNERT